MSTRYVWGKYNQGTPVINYDTEDRTAFTYQYYASSSDYGSNPPIAQATGLLNTGYVYEDVFFYAGGAAWDVPNTQGTHTQDRNFIIPKNANSKFANDPYYAGQKIFSKNAMRRKDNSYTWNLSYSYSSVTVTLVDSYGGTHPFEFYSNPTRTVPRGDYISDISGSYYSAYPQDGASGSYYYVYKGSDSIDPTALTYSKQNIQNGDTVTVTVTPGTPTYGGTIYYQYSYSTNGGSTWANIGSRTTSKTASVTVPEFANQFRVRVVASDSMGFTSSTYVYAQNFVLNEAPTAPAFVTIPESVYTNSRFTITWGASTDPDGNLTGYDIERAYDGGSTWTALTFSGTGTSTTDLIVEEHTSVQYRVRAKDSHSLTSLWTNSNVALIGKLKAYIGVNQKAKAIAKIYVGVNGKAKEVVQGYIGVNGKARKFL